MPEEEFVQIVVSQLHASATREQFIDLHRQTADWMRAHPDCISYEVFERAKGAIADRIVWMSKAGAMRGNQEYAQTSIASGMQSIVASYITCASGRTLPTRKNARYSFPAG